MRISKQDQIITYDSLYNFTTIVHLFLIFLHWRRDVLRTHSCVTCGHDRGFMGAKKIVVIRKKNNKKNVVQTININYIYI